MLKQKCDHSSHSKTVVPTDGFYVCTVCCLVLDRFLDESDPYTCVDFDNDCDETEVVEDSGTVGTIPVRRSIYKRISYLRVRLAQWRTFDPPIPPAVLSRIRGALDCRDKEGRRQWPSYARLTKRDIHRVCRSLGYRTYSRNWIKIKRLLLDAPIPYVPDSICAWLTWFHDLLQKPFQDLKPPDRMHFVQLNYVIQQGFLNMDRLFGLRLHSSCATFFPLLKSPQNLATLNVMFAKMVSVLPPSYGLVAFTLSKAGPPILQGERDEN